MWKAAVNALSRSNHSVRPHLEGYMHFSPRTECCITSPCGSVFRAVPTGPGIPIPTFLQEVNDVPIYFQYSELDFQSAVRIILICCRRDSPTLRICFKRCRQ